jgi:DNA gyrase/topoisomerase IV subunit A
MKDVSAEARNKFMEYLIKKFNVTDIEAKFIMNMDQMKVAKGYLNMYKEECKQLEKNIKEYQNRLTDGGVAIKKEIVEELEYFKKKYYTPRICRVVKDSGVDIPAGEFLVVITESNRVRKINIGAVNSVRGDNPKFVLKMDNRDNNE